MQPSYVIQPRTKKPFTLLTIGVLGLVALIHLLRLVFVWEVTVNVMIVPMWVSVLAMVITGSLALMLWREM